MPIGEFCSASSGAESLHGAVAEAMLQIANVLQKKV